MSQVVGIIAATCTTLSFVPQAIMTIKTQNTSSISSAMYFIFTTGVFFWTVYGIFEKSPTIIVPNVITFVLAMSILIIIVKNQLNATNENATNNATNNATIKTSKKHHRGRAKIGRL